MPSNNHKPRVKEHRPHRRRHADSDTEEKRRKNRPRPTSNFRRAYWGSNKEESENPDADRRKHDDKLRDELSEALVPYSRQRLRAFHMSLRQYANNEGRVTAKELNQSLQDNQMIISSRSLQPLIENFEDLKGVDVEGFYRFMTDAHSKTGRDSVLAMHKRNDLIPRLDVSQDEIDEDLIWRIESLLIKAQAYIDIPELRTALQERDNSKTGKIESSVVRQICNDKQMPVFGALLKNLIRRCDDEKNEKISWPEFISFLERAQQNAWKRCPELKEIPDKMKQQAPVEPSPIDELSSRTRNTLVSKLRKKASILKPERTESMIDNTRKTPEIIVAVQSDNTETVTLDTASSSKCTGNDTMASEQSMENEINKMEEEPSGKDSEVVTNVEDVTLLADTDTPRDNDTHGHEEGLSGSAKADNTVSLNIIPPESSAATEATDKKEKTASTDKKNVTSKKTKNENSPNRKLSPGAKRKTEKHASPKTNKSTSKRNNKSSPNKNDVVSPASKTKPLSNGTIGISVADEDETITGKTGQSGETGYQQAVLEQDREPRSQLNTVHAPKVRHTKHQISVTVKGTEVTLPAPAGLSTRRTIDPPRERMKLHWLYGYRGNDCRKNIHTLASSEIVYFMSYIAVIYNRDTHKQRHYKEHTEEIKCIDVHSNGIVVATGQFASRKNEAITAHIRVWRSDILQTLRVCGEGQFQKSVACLAFSPGKDLLAAVDNSLEKRLTVWNTTTGQQHGEQILNTDLVCDIGFNKKDPETMVTVGKEHVCWWKIYPESNTIQTSAIPEYEGFLKAKFIICLTFTDRGDLITGDSNGTIYIWGECGNKITNYIKHAHDGPVFTVLCHHGYILSGGRDGIIHCWLIAKNMDASGFVECCFTSLTTNGKLSELKLERDTGVRLSVRSSIPKTDGGVRMLQVSENSLLIGTTMNSMLTLTMAQNEAPLTETTIDSGPLTQGHYDELRGLTIVETPGCDVITAGMDGIICSYNSRECRAISKFQVKGNQYLCVDADSTGTLLALGTRDGHLQIMSLSDGAWTELVNQKLCKDRLDTIKVSPDCMHIAAGGHDSCIYVYGLMEKEDETCSWEYMGKLKGHAGPISGMDWSRDKDNGVYQLRSSSDALDYKLWTPATLESRDNLEGSAGIHWTSHSCVINAATVGILASKHTTETEIESLDVNPAESLVAMGDNCGSLNLFRFPATSSGAFCHAYKSHACVHAVKFTGSGTHVMTVGGRDSCLMQWELV